MTVHSEIYYCESCGRGEWSSVGDPHMTWGSGRQAKVVCLNCYRTLEKEEADRLRDEIEAAKRYEEEFGKPVITKHKL